MEQENTQGNEVKALDWGISFALSRWKLLMCFALAPAAVELLIAYLYFSTPLPPQQMFLTLVLATGMSAWLLTVVSMSSITEARGELLKLRPLTLKAFSSLPKIFFCYMGLISLLALCYVLPLLIFVFVLFTWAPLFCVAELFVEEEPSNDEPDHDDDDDIFARKRVLPESEVSLLRNKSIFELGFARSLQIARSNIPITLQVGLVVWCANLVPTALLGLLFPTSSGFAGEFFRVVVVACTHALALGVTAGTFIFLLPEKSRTELGINAATIDSKAETRKPGWRLQGNTLATCLLGVLAIGSALLWGDQLRNSRLAPSSLKVEVRKVEMKTDSFDVSLYLNDEEQDFRWLDVRSLRLGLNDKKLPALSADTVLMDANKTPTKQDAVAVPQKDFGLLKTFGVSSEHGEELSKTHFVPSEEPIILHLSFDLPEAAPEKGDFTIYYSTLLTDNIEVAHGRYGSW